MIPDQALVQFTSGLRSLIDDMNRAWVGHVEAGQYDQAVSVLTLLNVTTSELAYAFDAAFNPNRENLISEVLATAMLADVDQGFTDRARDLLLLAGQVIENSEAVS